MFFYFEMGQKVRLVRTTKGGHSKGRIGIVTAMYDKEFTPGQYPTSDYRVTFGPKQEGNNNQCYCMQSDLEAVETIKAYAFVKNKKTGTAEKGDYSWKSSEKAMKGFRRAPEFDIEKEIGV